MFHAVHPFEASPPRRVAILRALKIGDLLVAVPALRAVRSALPSAEIVLVGLPWAREFVERFSHLLDGFREFPGWPGLPERKPLFDSIPRFLTEIQAERFDLVLQMHGSGLVVNDICAQFAAHRTAGFHPAGDRCPDPMLFLPWPEQGLELRRLLALTEFLGFPTCGEHLEFPLRDTDFASIARLGLELGEYACIHPGASVPERRWPAEYFAAVADHLAARGLQVVLTGTAGERELTRAIARAAHSPVIDLAGQTNLGAAAALLARARMLVCNDTGVSHLAAAVGTPSVVISTHGNPARWAPLDADRHRVLCRQGGWPEISEVLPQVEDLLGSSRSPATLHEPEKRSCARSAC